MHIYLKLCAFSVKVTLCLQSQLNAVTLAPHALASFVGSYRYTGNPRTTLLISIINRHLFLSSESDLLRLEPTLVSNASATFKSFDGESFETSVTFSSDANGKVTSFVIHFYDGTSPDLKFNRVP
jgi:hypothetical protein